MEMRCRVSAYGLEAWNEDAGSYTCLKRCHQWHNFAYEEHHSGVIAENVPEDLRKNLHFSIANRALVDNVHLL